MATSNGNRSSVIASKNSRTGTELPADDDRYAVGVDLGGTFLKLALLGPAGRVAARKTVPTVAAEGHGAGLVRTAAGVRRLAARAAAGAVGSVGVGVPGLIEAETGVVRDLFNLRGG